MIGHEHQRGEQANGRCELGRGERGQRRQLAADAADSRAVRGQQVGEHARNRAQRRQDLDRADERARAVDRPSDRRDGNSHGDGHQRVTERCPHGANR